MSNNEYKLLQEQINKLEHDLTLEFKNGILTIISIVATTAMIVIYDTVTNTNLTLVTLAIWFIIIGYSGISIFANKLLK